MADRDPPETLEDLRYCFNVVFQVKEYARQNDVSLWKGSEVSTTSDSNPNPNPNPKKGGGKRKRESGTPNPNKKKMCWGCGKPGHDRPMCHSGKTNADGNPMHPDFNKDKRSFAESEAGQNYIKICKAKFPNERCDSLHPRR